MRDRTEMTGSGRGFASRAVHAGEHAARPEFTPTATPIYLSSSFSYDNPETLDAVFGDELPGYVYTRHGNPTCRAFEIAVAALEETDDAIAVASGMAALHLAVLNEVQAGSAIVAASDLYGATTALLTNLFGTLGIKTSFVDVQDLEAVQRVIADIRPKAILLESISNPLLRVPDLGAIVEIAHRHQARVIVDNTFATPYLITPSRLGVDVVVHSSTKYLGGHGDVTGGIVCSRQSRIDDIRELNKLNGATLGPFEAWLTLRGIKTLPLRVRQQSESAAKIAAWLLTHPAIERVNYPGLATCAINRVLFNNELRGGMISFEVRGAGRAEIFRLFAGLRLCQSATTLGDVYTLVLYPPMSSHRGLTPEERAAIGIGDGLVRLSVGIEDVDDIIEDLDQALRPS